MTDLTTTSDRQHIEHIRASAERLFSADDIAAALERMALAMTNDLATLDPVLLVVMNGGLVVAGQLLPRLNFPLRVDYCHVTRYRGDTAGGELRWLVHPQSSLAGEHVVVIDDVLDEGHTLIALLAALEQQSVASVRTAVLVNKQHDRKAIAGLAADYCGLQAPDRYLFGFGMDYQHYWRNTATIDCIAEA